MDSTRPFVGRAVTQILVPFKFVEAVRYDKFVSGKKDYDINSTKKILKSGLADILKKKDISEADINGLYSKFQDAYRQLAIEEPHFKALLASYMIKGGYPKAVKELEFKKCVESLTTNYRDVINSDIKQAYSIRKPQLMEAVLVPSEKYVLNAEGRDDCKRPGRKLRDYKRIHRLPARHVHNIRFREFPPRQEQAGKEENQEVL